MADVAEPRVDTASATLEIVLALSGSVLVLWLLEKLLFRDKQPDLSPTMHAEFAALEMEPWGAVLAAKIRESLPV
jgi:hypothetical protein